MNWMKGTTYTPASGFGSLVKRNAGTDQFQGLSPRGQSVVGAFGAGMSGAGNQMMGKPQPFMAPRMDEMPPAMPEMAPAMPPQGGAGGAFGPSAGPGAGMPKPRQMPSNGFLDYLRNR